MGILIIMYWFYSSSAYNHYMYNNIQMRDLMERVRRDWNELNNVQEVEIIKKYSAIGKLITLFSTCKRRVECANLQWDKFESLRFLIISIVAAFIYLCTFSFILIYFSVNLYLDFTTAVNESRVREFPAVFEYFIDQQKYYYPLSCHVTLSVVCGLTTMIATETIYMLYTQHACGLFQIAR